MKQQLFIVLLGIISIAIGGCEAVVDFPETNGLKQVPVVEALLTDQMEPQTVHFCYSSTIKDSVSAHPVEHATVFVYSSKGDTMWYNHTGSGYYQSKPYCAAANITYTLVIQSDTACYRASSTLIPMNGLENVKIVYTPKYANDDSAYYLHFGIGPVMKDNPRYYLTRIIRNHVEITKESSFAILSDKFDKTLDDIKVQYALKLEDTVTLELYSLSQKVYSIYEQMNRIAFLNYSSVGFMENPISMFDKYAMGFFQVSAVDKKTIVVR
ncbi:MAG TPA: DUF4249 family protein [Bacteroidales bacterium]|nr:DUF4249 family protein [Bacteroidales bacterium]